MRSVGNDPQLGTVGRIQRLSLLHLLGDGQVRSLAEDDIRSPSYSCQVDI